MLLIRQNIFNKSVNKTVINFFSLWCIEPQRLCLGFYYSRILYNLFHPLAPVAHQKHICLFVLNPLLQIRFCWRSSQLLKKKHLPQLLKVSGCNFKKQAMCTGTRKICKCVVTVHNMHIPQGSSKPSVKKTHHKPSYKQHPGH